MSPKSKKSGRGFAHPLTSRLLCPHRYLTVFDADSARYVETVISVDRTGVNFASRTVAQFEEGLLVVDANKLPTFLYDFNREYNEANILDGLLRSPILTRVRVLLFPCYCARLN